MMSRLNNCNVLGANYEPGYANFTNVQGARMRSAIVDPINTALFSGRTTTVLSLYQPFSVVTLSNGLKEHKFQKGFTYSFYDSVAPNPLTATTSVSPIISSVSADYRMRIYQIDTSLYVNDFQWVLASTPNTLTAPMVEDTFVNGKIISSSQFGVFPFTTQILNSFEVNDPKLKEKLGENQYYIITKESLTGSKIQEVIYKN